MTAVPPAARGDDLALVGWILDVLSELIVGNSFEQKSNKPDHETDNDSYRSWLEGVEIGPIPDVCEEWRNSDQIHEDTLQHVDLEEGS